MRFFVGIDWAEQAHAVCILDPVGRVSWQGSVPHSAEGLAELLGRLRRLRQRGLVRVALERPSAQRRRQRRPDPRGARRRSGLAPVTHASGQHRAVVFRWACNKRVRRALTTLADNSRHASQWAAFVYQRARARGCRHQHAIRILAPAWARILWRCWLDRAPYDVSRQRAAQALAAA